MKEKIKEFFDNLEQKISEYFWLILGVIALGVACVSFMNGSTASAGVMLIMSLLCIVAHVILDKIDNIRFK